MTALTDHQSNDFVKLIYIGDSGTGKTGSLVSLMPEYDLRILDYDNGLDALKAYARRDCPDRLSHVDFETLRDTYKVNQMFGAYVPAPKAYVAGLKLLEKWSDGTDPAEWGPGTIFVLDSLTEFGQACYWWARQQNPTTKDVRQWYKAAQDAVKHTLSLLMSEAFHCNVIVISHVTRLEVQGVYKGFPSAIGSALSPLIPRHFNTYVAAEKQVKGKKVERTIGTGATIELDLKNPLPDFTETLPLGTGLATIFHRLKQGETA